MRVLGIESSSTVASIAILEDRKLLCEYTINNTMKHSKTLMPMLEEVLKRLEIEVNTIDLISISEGPGSFTGLRIGSATAKGLAHGLNIPIANVKTLEVLASQVHIPNAKVGVVVFARARELYYGSYNVEFQNNHFLYKEIESIADYEIEDLIVKLKRDLQETERDFVLVGDGLDHFENEFITLGNRIIKMPSINCSYSAKSVALLGLERYYSNDVITCYEQKPYYHKKSQAEREYEEKNTDD